MAIGDDISISAARDIRYTGTTANYSMIEFIRWLGSLATDGQAVGDDIMDITSDTPIDRSTDNFATLINSYNIDDVLATHLYDGSLLQLAGAERYDGITNYGTQGIYIEVMQNGALVTPNFWTTGLNPDVLQGISHRFLIKTRVASADIDGRRLLGLNREFNFSYGEFAINGTLLGNNTLALSHSSDLNNTTPAATVATWTTITNIEGFRQIDVDANATPEDYYSEWNRDTFLINQMIERGKWLQRRGSASTLYGLTGGIFRGITHEIDIDTNLGTFSAVEAVSWGTGATAGTGQMLAINSVSAGTKMWIQILTGVVPTDGLVITGATSTASAAMNLTITARTVSPSFMGLSTGTALVGAYGLGVEAADLNVADKLTDLTDSPIAPPNNVTYTVNGLVATEDRLLAAAGDGILANKINETQFTLATTLNGAVETSVVVGTAIPSDWPASGTIRIQLDSQIYRRVAYSSYAGSTFSILGTDFSADPATSTNNPNVFMTPIDKLAGAASETVTWIYNNANGPQNLFIRARDGGITPIKTFESVGAMGANGGSITIIRTPDI